MRPFPKKINNIIHHLATQNIHAVYVGGCVRDALSNRTCSDFDIECYNVESLDKLHHITAAFGRVNTVGKSFGIIKLYIAPYTIDLSLPRTEIKTGQHHRDFDIHTHTNLDYKTAAMRRDFTINAIALIR